LSKDHKQVVMMVQLDPNHSNQRLLMFDGWQVAFFDDFDTTQFYAMQIFNKHHISEVTQSPQVLKHFLSNKTNINNIIYSINYNFVLVPHEQIVRKYQRRLDIVNAFLDPNKFSDRDNNVNDQIFKCFQQFRQAHAASHNQ
jgi:hypothetical protein